MDPRTAARNVIAISISDAKEILGFPASYDPTPAEISKAWRTRSIANHPDRGGDHRKMVELNVAKDVLTGLRTNDRTDRVDTQTAEEKKRQAELRADIATINREADAAEKAMQAAIGHASGVLASKHRIDVHEFLTHDFASAIDTLHETAEHIVKTAENPKDKEAAAKVLVESTHLSSTALRLANKFNALKRAVDIVSGFHCSVNSLAALSKEANTFAPLFLSFYQASSKLMSFLNSPEGEVIPFLIVDMYGDEHQRIIAFKDNFAELKGHHAEKANSQVLQSVNRVLEILGKYGAAVGYPDWKQWEIPREFHRAVEDIGTAAARPKNAAVERVLDRYIQNLWART